MAKITPISMSSVTFRRSDKSSNKPAKVTMQMYNYVRDNLNTSTLTEFANNVSKSMADSNRYWQAVLELAGALEKKTGKRNMELYRTISYSIFPKLDKNSIKEAKAYVKSECMDSINTSIDKNKLSSLLEDYAVIDRIAANHNSLSKRFNINKLAEEAAHKTDISEAIYEMCDLIDTYDMPLQAKYNIALENISYAMYLAGYDHSVVEEITDYYLSSNPIIPDYKFKSMQNLVKKSRVLSESDKESLRYFTEAKNDTYAEHIQILADQCKDSESKQLILSALKIKTEKQAAEYIKKAISFSQSHETDEKYIIGSIFAIPLMGRVSKAFVSYQYKLAMKKTDKGKTIKDTEFQKKVEEILDDEDELMIEATLFDEEEVVDESVLNTIYMDTPIIEAVADPIIESYAELLESEDFADTEDIKKCINDFKAEQKKDVGKFKYYLGKIYRKSPENIIDETPHILSVIRYSFIIAPTVTLPGIGPIISLIMLFIDKMLSMKINDKQSEKLIRKLESELDKVDKDIERKPEKKAELEKYKKCIEQCVKKVDAYREAHISDEELENRRGSSNFDLDDDFKFEDDDFKLEKALVSANAINTILEAQQSNITEKLCNIITDESLMMDIDTLYTIYEMASRCKTCINISDIKEAILSIKYKKYSLYEGTYITGKISSFTFPDDASGINDVVMEAFCVDLLNEGIDIVNKAKDSVKNVRDRFPKMKPINLDKLKIVFHAARGKMKDLSTKEKALWKNVDIYASGFMRGVEKAMTNDRREAIIKGSIIPSFSKCIKTSIVLGGVTFVNPILGLIATLGMIGTSKALNHKERQLIYDEIDTELKVIDKEIQLADNEGDMKKYRVLLQYQKRLEREKQRIKYGIKVHGRDIPEIKRKDDY